MMRIEPFKPEHLQRIAVQGHQALVKPLLDSPEYIAGLMSGPAYSAIEGDEVLACVGLIMYWQGRAHAWSILAGDLGGRMLMVHRAVMGYLAECPVRRIEVAVDRDFPQGHRWMKMLGFRCEVQNARGYMPDGGPASLYARVIE